MSAYMEPIKFAFLFFPLLAFLFTIPYMISQYRKYGSILFFRVLIVYSFILYLTTIYFLVILPLPPLEEVAQYTSPSMQLIPFAFVGDFFRETHFMWNDPSTYLATFRNPAFYQVFYNILLTLPFGLYLRYYFKCSFKKTVFLTFLLSLFFEVTQLTGLYFIYPRSYRLFDVDDLMINTLGGIIGFVITPFLTGFLPSKEKLDHTSYERGKQVSFMRRFVALGIDFIACTILLAVVQSFSLRYTYYITVALYFLLLPILTKGRTIGKLLVRIRVVDEEEKPPKVHQYLIRYGILYGLIIPLPYYALQLIELFFTRYYPFQLFFIMAVILLGLLGMWFCFDCALALFAGKSQMTYEKMSRTKNKSTINIAQLIAEEEHES